MTLALSVIIPTLNEAENLPRLLEDLQRQQHIELDIIIADGDSTDGTLSLARASGLTVVQTEAGRGRQMNAGFKKARHDYLLFLHADSRLASTTLLSRALQALQREDGPQHHTAGHFPLHFERSTKQHALAFRYMETKSSFNRRHCQNGDQGLMIHRDFFISLGGFDEALPFFEDFQMAEKIHAQGRWITLPGQLNTSARRFESEGLRARYLLMGLIVTAEQADIPEFVSQAPKIYESQDATGRLLLTPYFRTFAHITRQRGLRGSWQALLNIGHLSRLHWWQCFLFFDNLFSLKNRPILRFYDRIIYPLTAHRIGDMVSACIAWVVGMWLLRPYFRLREHRALTRKTLESTA